VANDQLEKNDAAGPEEGAPGNSERHPGGIPAPLSQPTCSAIESRRLWTLRDLLLFLVYVPFALFASNLLVGAGYGVLRSRLRWLPAPGSIANEPLFLLALQLVFYGFLLGYIYLLVAVHYRQPFWSALAWRKPGTKKTLLYLLGGFLLAIVVRVIPPLLPDTENFPLEQLFKSPEAAYAVGVFAITVAPLMEELIFRGLLFAVFDRQVGVRFAVLATAILFAGLHVPEYWRAWNHVLLLFLVGLVFSLARGMTGSLAPSVMLHMGYNASMMAGVFFQTQHFRALHAYFVG
jgi:membrane protease YdiL (CAAX protease family)